MATITNDGSDIIFKKIEKTSEWHISPENLEEVFNIRETVNWIKERQFSVVGLQFPNELLSVSISLLDQISESCEALCVILADTSFGSCCIDEVAGQRLNVDAVVHYGRACLTETVNRIPHFYVFGRLSIEETVLKDWCQSVYSQLPENKPVILFYDFRYMDAAKRFRELLTSKFKVIFTKPNLKEDSTPGAQILSGRVLSEAVDFAQCSVVYLGKPELSLYRILTDCHGLDFARCFCCDPTRPQTIHDTHESMNELLRRRFYLVERAKEAKRVGILVGTLSSAHYREILDRLCRLLRIAGRLYTLLFVGKLNAAKLLNLTDIDIYVMVACPESSYLDSREFMTPLVTPFEMECALAASASSVEDEQLQSLLEERNFTCERLYPSFADLLEGGRSHVDERAFSQLVAAERVPSVSLITGRLQEGLHVRSTGEPGEGTTASGEMLLRDSSSWQLAETLAWQRANRSWYGLDPRLGQDEAQTQVTEGRSGIPMNYGEANNS